MMSSPKRSASLAKKAPLVSPRRSSPRGKKESSFSSPAIIPSSNPSSPCKYDTDAEIGALAKSVSLSLNQKTYEDSDDLPDIADRRRSPRSPRKNPQAPNSPIISLKRVNVGHSCSASIPKVKCSQPDDEVIKPGGSSESGDADPKSQTRFHPGRDGYDVMSAHQSRGLFAEDVEDAEEIWLVQAPSSMDIKTLSRLNLEFEGQQVLRQSTKGGPDTVRISYSSSNPTVDRLSVVLPSRESKRWNFVSPQFAGKMAISQEYEVPEPTYPAPSCPSFDLPDGLKRRYVPFGCGGTDDVISAGQDERLEIPESADEENNEKKKKKKRKK